MIVCSTAKLFIYLPSSFASMYLLMSYHVLLFEQRGCPPSVGKETVSASDEDTIADLMEQHEQFLNSAQTQLTKLQVICDN